MRHSILLLLVMLLAGCSDSPGNVGEINRDDELPLDATDIKYEGNGWVSFKWEGNCFLLEKNSGFLASNFDRAFSQYDCPKQEPL